MQVTVLRVAVFHGLRRYYDREAAEPNTSQPLPALPDSIPPTNRLASFVDELLDPPRQSFDV